MKRAPLVLVLVENLPLPGDRRVWLECSSLRDAGYRVAAITPKGKDDPAYELHEGVHLYKYAPPRLTSGYLSYAWEFIYCWLMTLRLVAHRRAEARSADVLQACNPPDTFWPLALLLRPFGTRFVFDQHDLCPETFESKFGRRGVAHRGLLAPGEGDLPHRASRHRHQRVVQGGGDGPRPGARSPESPWFAPGRTPPSCIGARPITTMLRGHDYLVHFHGVMGRQDGVEIVLETVREFLAIGRTDTFFNIMGAGDDWPRLRKLATEWGLDDFVFMPGRVSDEDLFASMSTAVVGLSPDLPGPLNDVSTMNKTMEYMAFGLPVLVLRPEGDPGLGG